MYNDSIENLLLRHYGDNGSTPEALEQHLCASVQQQARDVQQQEIRIKRLSEQRISRRRAVQLVALSSAGIGLLSASVASVQALLSSPDSSQPSYSS